MLEFYRRLVAMDVKYLVGYVGAVDVFAEFLATKELTLSTLRAVWTTAAPLPHAKRVYLESIYHAPVYTQYGSCEFYWLSAECSQRCGLHLASDERHLETVDENCQPANGALGDILVTDLTNWAFPMIRYRIGDRGRLLDEKCPCGLPYPLMDYVRGRSSDVIFLPDGTGVPGEFWTTIFDDYVGAIRAFNVHQHLDYSVEIAYEPAAGVDFSAIEEQVTAKLLARLKGQAKLSFVRKAANLYDNGKLRYVVSDVPARGERHS